MRKLIMMSAILLTTVWQANSQKSSDSIKVHKKDVREAIQASRKVKVLTDEIALAKRELDTCQATVGEQTLVIDDQRKVIEARKKMSELQERENAVLRDREAGLKKESRKYKRQRNGAASVGVLSIILLIILI